MDYLAHLPPQVQHTVVADFDHQPHQTNASARCMAFAKSLLAGQQGRPNQQHFQQQHFQQQQHQQQQHFQQQQYVQQQAQQRPLQQHQQLQYQRQQQQHQQMQQQQQQGKGGKGFAYAQGQVQKGSWVPQVIGAKRPRNEAGSESTGNQLQDFQARW